MCGAMPSGPKPYEAQVWRGGKKVYLGSFATAEEAALCIARSLEGRAAAERAAAAPPLTREEEGKGSFAKEEGVVPPMPPDVYVKIEVVVKEEESSEVAGPRGGERSGRFGAVCLGAAAATAARIGGWARIQ